MSETQSDIDLYTIVGPQETWRVVMGTPLDYSLKCEIDVEALSDFGAYWEAVALKPEWYVERIFPVREAL